LPKATPIEVWFQDEARLGQKNGRTRLWARTGTRPRLPADQRYANAYLFGAICPRRGTGAALMLPTANAETMQLHLDEISRHIARKAHAVVLMDRAGWHRADRLKVPNNITIILLPSRSPNSTRSKTSGNTFARTGCRTASSKPMTTSSRPDARLGTGSSPSPKQSRPSACEIGPMRVNNYCRWY
jgi:DDE superfamily endonuclease